jgi:hypothetical protein
VLVNRLHRDEIGIPDIERLLRHPVMAAFPNDYQGVRKATIRGQPVASDSRLGRAYAAFSQQIAAGSQAKGAISQLFHSLLTR